MTTHIYKGIILLGQEFYSLITHIYIYCIVLLYRMSMGCRLSEISLQGIMMITKTKNVIQFTKRMIILISALSIYTNAIKYINLVSCHSQLCRDSSWNVNVGIRGALTLKAGNTMQMSPQLALKRGSCSDYFSLKKIDNF